jgi:hypothetical protein
MKSTIAILIVAVLATFVVAETPQEMFDTIYKEDKGDRLLFLVVCICLV